MSNVDNLHALNESVPALGHAELLQNATNGSGAPMMLCQVVCSVVAPWVKVDCAMSGVVTGGVGALLIVELTIDGVVVHSAGTLAGSAQSVAFTHAQPLSQGPHTFAMNFYATGGGTANCRPVLTPATENAAMSLLQGFASPGFVATGGGGAA